MSEIENDQEWEEYFIPGTDVLKNCFGIVSEEELYEKEAQCSAQKLIELYKKPIEGCFDAEHLKAIHKYILGEVYPFAGEYRTVDMRKQTHFLPVRFLEKTLEMEMDTMHKEFEKCHTYNDYTRFLAYTYGSLTNIHPFREGNGRAIREFIREFVEAKMPEYTLKWSLADGNNLFKGVIAFFEMRTPTFLEMEFRKALVTKEKKQTNTMK